MMREHTSPRLHWRARVEELGFDFHTIGGTYWDESARYRFSAAEIDALDDATAELHRLCLEAVKEIVRTDRNGEVGIADQFWPWVKRSFERGDPSLYGRIDLAYDGTAIKMLEYNADTPTALFEAGVVQWQWLQDTLPGADQFNSIHEKLIERWQAMRLESLHVTALSGSVEDQVTVDYLADTAVQAGIGAARFVELAQIGWNGPAREFVDAADQPIRNLFKLYPWEWIFSDEFGAHLSEHRGLFIEPPWKAILSNKGILPILWELFPGHPHLLPAYRDAAKLEGKPHAVKPVHSREGANIALVGRGTSVERSGGPYGGPCIYQGLATIPNLDGNYPVIGSWIVGDQTAGIGIREDASPITQNTSRFVPHYFLE